MSNAEKKAPEPSMDDIINSIRSIIADESPIGTPAQQIVETQEAAPAVVQLTKSQIAEPVAEAVVAGSGKETLSAMADPAGVVEKAAPLPASASPDVVPDLDASGAVGDVAEAAGITGNADKTAEEMLAVDPVAEIAGDDIAGSGEPDVLAGGQGVPQADMSSAIQAAAVEDVVTPSQTAVQTEMAGAQPDNVAADATVATAAVETAPVQAASVGGMTGDSSFGEAATAQMSSADPETPVTNETPAVPVSMSVPDAGAIPDQPVETVDKAMEAAGKTNVTSEQAPVSAPSPDPAPAPAAVAPEAAPAAVEAMASEVATANMGQTAQPAPAGTAGTPMEAGKPDEAAMAEQGGGATAVPAAEAGDQLVVDASRVTPEDAAAISAVAAATSEALVGETPETEQQSAGKECGSTLEDSIKEMLKPLIREWLDDNMPRILEGAVREEVKGSGGKSG